MTRTPCEQDVWNVPPAVMVLGGDEVHVWRARLVRRPAEVERLLKVLAPDERERAERFHFRRDHDRFVVARAALRQILSGYLRVTPGRVRFTYSPYGKPGLAVEPCDLKFNVAHSNVVALYAFARGCEVGDATSSGTAVRSQPQVLRRFMGPYGCLRSTRRPV